MHFEHDPGEKLMAVACFVHEPGDEWTFVTAMLRSMDTDAGAARP
jgi:hypothetical protein